MPKLFFSINPFKYTSHAKILGKMCNVLLKYLSKRVILMFLNNKLILKYSGLLKQRTFWYYENKMAKGHIFVWHPIDTGISLVTASNSVFYY